MSSSRPYLASWERRLIAATIDTLLLAVVAVVLLGMLQPVFSPMGLAVCAPLIYIAYHAASMRRPEISLGRTACDILVVSIRGNPVPSTFQSVLRPTIRLILVAVCVFGKVVTEQWEMVSRPLIAAPFILEMILMAHTPSRRTLADFLAGTMVVRKPPLQPHRAPAYPMYSAKDEEFGPKP